VKLAENCSGFGYKVEVFFMCQIVVSAKKENKQQKSVELNTSI